MYSSKNKILSLGGYSIMFGDIIFALRKSKNLSQVQVAKDLEVSKQTISNWENNNILPSIDMLIRISKYWNVSTDYLLELDHRTYLEISDLTLEQLSHIQQIINDIKNSHRGLDC
jgi:transcriptional regulator with XRE-family HTH domain